MKVADDISRGTLECEWVKLHEVLNIGTFAGESMQSLKDFDYLNTFYLAVTKYIFQAFSYEL